MLNNNKKALIWGGAFGLVAPFVGMFVGLQVSPVVANILMFPILGMSMVLNSPFGMWSPALMLAGLLVSIVVWAIVFAIASALLKQIRG
ncbi:hypothetical protein A2704_05965 [Candidatus Kaiserbacteria bacterium RIFCSPHIGHO2_01_FULL_54_36b]|uniref:Uncharacterized protein n=1 Tax=Candidatus Kaiserbacteria bacterium RIFCSPHIGHO2_01_FULL_54_36b TaxID=1798483 RepID=A0A1F6CPG3_9BACT|nr:MAG: hypothetical protein A2704_05965 [Candidatus Kaiserbacteria bacterium RIFCSPHIGHO2_01_FULL_54_36b]